MRFIILLFITYSARGDKKCTEGDKEQNLFIVSCDHEGFHIIVEENCRQSDYGNINFAENVYISSKDGSEEGGTGIPPKPSSGLTAGVCKPNAKEKSYTNTISGEVIEQTVWAMDFAYDACGDIEPISIEGYFQYKVYLTEVETLTKSDEENGDTTEILVDKTLIQCHVPKSMEVDGSILDVDDDIPSTTIISEIDESEITLTIEDPAEIKLGEIIKLALDADDKLKNDFSFSMQKCYTYSPAEEDRKYFLLGEDKPGCPSVSIVKLTETNDDKALTKIEFDAFRFPSSSQVVVTCEIKVCQKDDKCWDNECESSDSNNPTNLSKRRKRRSNDNRNSLEKTVRYNIIEPESSSVPATIASSIILQLLFIFYSI